VDRDHRTAINPAPAAARRNTFIMTCVQTSTLEPTLPWDEAASDARWHVLHTRSRQEKAVAADLAARGIAHFLPLARHQRYYGNRTVHADLPIFAGYVFLKGARDDAFGADRNGRLVQIIDVAEQEQLEHELLQIHRALRAEGPIEAFPFIKCGVRVRVRSGPFKDMEGLVESVSQRHRVILQIQMLGRALSVEIDPSLVDLIR
jgi:transcription antitermination factor NusG